MTGDTATTLDGAEQEARWLIVNIEHLTQSHEVRTIVKELVEDRLRLIKRDRATLARHAPVVSEWDGTDVCSVCEFAPDYPCADASAVIDYWTETGSSPDKTPRQLLTLSETQTATNVAWTFTGDRTTISDQITDAIDADPNEVARLRKARRDARDGKRLPRPHDDGAAS